MTTLAAGHKKTADDRWIVDRRGRRVRLMDPMKLKLLHQDDVIDRDTLDRILNDLEPGLARRLKWFVLPLVISAGAMAGIFALLWAISDQNFRAGLVRVLTRNPGIYLPILVSAILGPLATAKKHRQRVPTLMLKYKRCPHCAYDLRGLPTDEEDGATVCPECACAWDLASASQVGSEVPALTPAGMSVPVKVGIVGALVLGAVVISVIVFGPASGGGATIAATALMVSAVVVVLGIVVAMLAIWRQGFGRR